MNSSHGRTEFSNWPWQKYQSGPSDHGSVANKASGACNGWGPGPALGPQVGVQGAKPLGKSGFYAILGVGNADLVTFS